MTLRPPSDLTCEYLHNPLGIDTRRPRFSWRVLHTERGERPAAYQVIVCSSIELAARKIGDLWDSGQVFSDRMAHIRYAGRPLGSRELCFWRVRWRDHLGRMSPFSPRASFEIGLLQKKDWRAQWISMKDPVFFRSQGTVLLGKYRGDYIQTRTIYLTKEFTAGPAIHKARAYICGLGFYELFINGLKVGDRVLDPAQTDYKKVALYATDDIVPFLSRTNTAVIILGNGRHIKNFGYGQPRVICQIEIKYKNGRRQIVATDETWTAGHGPLRENGIYFGEVFDSRLKRIQKKGNAVAVNGPPLRSQMLPPIRICRRLKPRKLFCPSPGVSIYDFGQNFAGWVRLRLKGCPGARASLRHAELLHNDGTLNVSPNQNAPAADKFILQGRGIEFFEPRFTYHGFRYAEVRLEGMTPERGFPGTPRLIDIEGCVVHTDVKPTGHFRCSQPLLNRIHRNILWGQRSNLMSIPTDCPQRDERQGWLGDAHLSAEEAIFNFDMASFYTKYLRDIRNAQRKNGSLPDTVPPYLGRLYPADPAWGSAYITLAWLLYWYYEDRAVLEEHFEGMKKYVNFLAANAEAHILKKLGKYGDWCPPGSIPPKKTPVALTSTWFTYHDTLFLSKIAAVLNKREEAFQYARLAQSIKVAFNRKFLEGDQYTALRVSPADRSVSQTSNVLPLFLEIVPSGKKEAVLKNLVRSLVDDQDYHLDTGIIGTRYLLDVLDKNGYADVAYRLACQTSYPSWGYMVKEGATTLWERWEKITGGGMNSHNHIMLGSVDAWFYKTIAGVRCQAPGWKKILIKPPDLPDLEYATCSLQTISGNVEVDWQRKDAALRLDIHIPVGAQAEIHVPLLWPGSVLKENGATIYRKEKYFDKIPELEFLGLRSGRLILKTLSGSYRFLLSQG